MPVGSIATILALPDDAILAVGDGVVVNLNAGGIGNDNAASSPWSCSSRIGSVVRDRIVVNCGSIANFVNDPRPVIVRQRIETDIYI